MDNPAYIMDCELEFGAKTKSSAEKPIKTYTFEEAITLTKVGIFHYKLLLICGFCFMSVMVEVMSVSMIMPMMKCDLKPTMTQQGMLASAGFLGIVLSSHAMGFLADTWGRVRLLRFALLFSAISSFISGFSVNIWMLIAFRFLTGFFISGGQACVFSLCGEFHGNASRVRHVTLLSSFMCIALMITPTMAMLLLPVKIDAQIFGMAFSSWRVFLITNVAISLLALLGLCTLPETPKYLLVHGNSEAALESLRQIYTKNTGNKPEQYPVHDIVLQTGGANLANVHSFKDAVKMIWQQTVPLFHRERCWHTINICLIQFSIYGVAHGFFMWFPTMLNDLSSSESSDYTLCSMLNSMGEAIQNSTNLNAENMDVECTVSVDNFTYQVLITIGAAFTVLYLIFAYIIDYIGKKNLLVGWLVLCVICLIGLHWFNQVILTVISLTLVMAIGNCGGLVSTIAMEFYPTYVNAMGMCFIMMIGRLGAVVGSNLVGKFLFNSCNNLLWAVLALVIVLNIMAWFLPEKKRQRQIHSFN